MTPAAAAAAEVGEGEPGEEMEGEDGEAKEEGREGGLGHHLHDVVVAFAAHGLEDAGPAPVGGNEGAGDEVKGLREGEDGAGERELEADEVDGSEGGLFGRLEPGGEAEADGGHGAIDQSEEEDLLEEIAGEAADQMDEGTHPNGLGQDQDGEEGNLRGEVAGGAKAGEFFLLELGAFGGDFASGIVGPHEGQENDLKHDESGDETADAGGLDKEFTSVDELLDDGLVEAHLEIFDIREAIPSEDGDENGKAEKEGGLQGELNGVAEENDKAAFHEGEELDQGIWRESREGI
jgi:hypothetical protein